MDLIVPLLLALLSSGPETNATVDDARINDLCFVDMRRGWAVGDSGLILATDDGGQTWRPQNSGVSHSLSAICFRDEKTGWATGGFARPYTHDSAGTVLITRDGGQTWSKNLQPMLPAFTRIGFFDARHGFAVGFRSSMYPSGVFLTDDGGRVWRPAPGVDFGGWTSGDFVDSQYGIAVGRNGSVSKVSRSEIEPLALADVGLRTLCQVRCSARGGGWICGEAGLVRFSGDLGRSWREPPGELPKSAKMFDFRALAVRGPKCWLAGSPGTRVFHTTDTGRTWTVFESGSTSPLRTIYFIDDERGWAGGDLGRILATDDGGKTWRVQRSGGERAGLLGIFAESRDVPLELIARLGGNDGYLAAVEVLCRRDIETPSRDDVHPANLLQEAVVLAGGCSANAGWRFPLRQSGLRPTEQQIVEAWDRVNEGRGLDELQAALVGKIRLWRPEVIVTHDVPTGGAASDFGDGTALASLFHRCVSRAISQAADANVFPEQIIEGGLAPWTVKKVFGTAPPGQRGGSDLQSAQFVPRLGRSLADAAAESRGLLFDEPAAPPSILGFRLMSSAAGHEQDRRDFMSGISPAAGGPVRRQLQQTPVEDIDRRQRIAQKTRHVQAILERSERRADSAESLLAQLDELTADLDEESRGRIIYQLGDRYRRTGRWALASETFRILWDRYPQHSLASRAMLWLLQYDASKEAACRVDRSAGQQQRRLEAAATLGQQIERTRPEWFADPAVCFPLAAAYRGLGQDRQAERLYQTQSHGGDGDGWAACARGELHTAQPDARQTKPTLICTKAGSKPHLDGRLDDAVWRRAKSAVLQSAQHDDGDWPAAVMLAYDAEFLYVAANCRSAKRSQTGGEQSQKARPRDADLFARDRIELLIDVDRDYAVFYRLAVDDRGWTAESCWGDATWNPKWFVAASRDGDVWTVEAAIPISELTDRPPHSHDVWAVGVQRIAPGVGFQSWNVPAAISVLPDGFGYLAFESE